jgi:hypothetical protein
MLLEALTACTTTYLSRKEDKYLFAFLSLNSDNDNKSYLICLFFDTLYVII